MYMLNAYVYFTFMFHLGQSYCGAGLGDIGEGADHGQTNP